MSFHSWVERYGARHCEIEILFLRRDHPGHGLIRSGGDIDNRIKVPFDALRMPQSCDELSGGPPQSGEDPFYCLLQDDRLITAVSVTTDRLLEPAHDGAGQNDVKLVILVRTQLFDPDLGGQIA